MRRRSALSAFWYFWWHLFVILCLAVGLATWLNVHVARSIFQQSLASRLDGRLAWIRDQWRNQARGEAAFVRVALPYTELSGPVIRPHASGLPVVYYRVDTASGRILESTVPAMVGREGNPRNLALIRSRPRGYAIRRLPLEGRTALLVWWRPRRATWAASVPLAAILPYLGRYIVVRMLWGSLAILALMSLMAWWLSRRFVQGLAVLSRADPVPDRALPLREMQLAQVRLSQAVGQLHRQATHDLLTGALNRLGLERALEAYFAAPARPALFVLFDLDHFKDLNDRLGHEAGDAALRAVTEAVRGRLKEEDLVARLGGDEFVAVLLGAHLSERMRERVAGLFRAVPAAVPALGVSLGVVELP
ncbi:MAG: GGDEF domain-containing protein, partial [Firmicutes bacterium]|nr:GGDEF domain-containing protein [Bacillota bacterium]